MGRCAITSYLLLALSVVAFGCSSGGTQVRPRAPWEEELAAFFDDAVDFIENPGDLQGTWATGYADELHGRIDEADLIGRVTVNTVNEDINVEGHRRKHLLMQISSVLRGDAPRDESLHLIVDERSPGFDTVDRAERRLIGNRFVVFVRWYEDEDGAVRGHWHLSPATRSVVELVRQTITERQQTSRQGEGDSQAEDDPE